MSIPVGWVVIARQGPEEDISVAGILDLKFALTGSTALEVVESRIAADHASWKLAAFAVTNMKPATKRNLEMALRKLGLHGYDVDDTYDMIVNHIGKSMLGN